MGLIVRNINFTGNFRGTFPQVPPPPPAPPIVSSGLIMNLDAGNVASYSGSGTSWLDLSNSSNNATLTNNPVFNSSFGGYFTFNGSSNYAPTTNSIAIGPGTSRTMEVVFQKLGNGGPLLYHNRTAYPYGFSGIRAGNTFNFEVTSNSGPPYSYMLEHNTQLQNSTWYHGIISIIIPASSGTMTANIGLNGNIQFQSISIVVNTAATPYVLEVARFINFIWGFEYGNVNVAIARVYNRALSQAEMEQNFNAIRGRYGL